MILFNAFIVFSAANTPLFTHILRAKKSNVSYKSGNHFPDEAECRNLKLFVGENILVSYHIFRIYAPVVKCSLVIPSVIVNTYTIGWVHGGTYTRSVTG